MFKNMHRVLTNFSYFKKDSFERDQLITSMICGASIGSILWMIDDIRLANEFSVNIQKST